jgi:hypothetical protein
MVRWYDGTKVRRQKRGDLPYTLHLAPCTLQLFNTVLADIIRSFFVPEAERFPEIETGILCFTGIEKSYAFIQPGV